MSPLFQQLKQFSHHLFACKCTHRQFLCWAVLSTAVTDRHLIQKQRNSLGQGHCRSSFVSKGRKAEWLVTMWWKIFCVCENLFFLLKTHFECLGPNDAWKTINIRVFTMPCANVCAILCQVCEFNHLFHSFLLNKPCMFLVDQSIIVSAHCLETVHWAG